MLEKINILPDTQIVPASVSADILSAPAPANKDIYTGNIQRLPIQRKLFVGAVDDPLEYEVNTMADKVMRMPEQSFIQRKCSQCEEEEAQRKPLTSFIQRRETGNSNTVSNATHNQIQSTRGGGTGMPANTKTFMESRFGADFSYVRIHSGGYSSQLTNELNAQAFTVGNDIYFNNGKFSPDSPEGKHLLAHELTHTIQQGATFSPSGNNIIQRQEDKRLDAIREKLRKGGKLTEDDIAYVKEQLGKEITQQVLGNIGQIGIDYDSSREPQDVNRHFRGRLELRLSGLLAGIAKSLQGVATTEIDLSAKVANEKGIITIAPPVETNRLAALIREQLFPNGSIRSFDFHFPKEYIKYANAVSLISGITVSITGKNGKHTTGMITIDDESVPSGIELVVTLSPSTRTTNVEDIKQKLPNDHWVLTPKPDVFGTSGYAGGDKQNAFTSTIGVDAPLAYDTKTPLIYVGLGARASIDTNRLARVGGTLFGGLNFDPLKLQLGFGAGAAFLKDPILTSDGPAQLVFYTELEGKVSYTIVPHVELLGILSVGGGKNLPAYGTAQAGVGYTF